MFLDQFTFNLINYVWIGIGLSSMAGLFFITAPYGRHATGLKRSWGPMISNRLGWIIMELPALIIFPTMFLLGPAEKTTVMWLIFSAFTFHYFNRVVIFPFRTRTTGKKIPLSVPLFGVIFNLTNGFLIGYYFGFFAEGKYTQDWLTDPRFIVGVALFALGMWINWRSDRRLFNLRKPGETGYKIPVGGWFRWVSCPNYFGEIVEWTGFALMCWNLPALTFLVWTISNLVPRALSHHKWYNDTFPEYPKDRKAIFPFTL